MAKTNEKKQTGATILAKAHKFFAKKNYAAAKKEYLKIEAAPDGGDDEIASQIQYCNQEIGRERAKVLSKKAQRLLKKDNLQEACDCFVEAFKLSQQEWIKEKIDQLHEKMNTADKHQEAPQAEAQGDYLKAAALYGQIYENQADPVIQRKRAHCLVMAERWPEAVTLYDELETGKNPDAGNRDIYNYGLALVNTGQNYQGLKTWLKIAASDPDFEQQKESVYARLQLEILEEVKNSTKNDNSNSAFRKVVDLLKWDSRPEHQKLLSYCLYAELEKLWQAENYVEIGQRLDELNNLDLESVKPHQLNLALIGLRAKACALVLAQKPAENQLTHAANFIKYWLTALYFPGVLDNDYDQTGKKEAAFEEIDKLQKQLLKHGFKLLENFIDKETETGKKITKFWDLNCNLLKDLELLGWRGNSGPRPLPIATPLFALEFGKSSILQKAIAADRDFFRDELHFLSSAAWYSPAARALQHSAMEEHECAAKLAATLQPQDKFTRFALLFINFSCGVYHLHRGEEKSALKHLNQAPELLHISPELEKVLIGTIYEVEDDGKLQAYENIFTKIARQYSSSSLNQALSLVMSRLSIAKANAEKMPAAVLKINLQKALQLDPENELARVSLNEALIADEIEQIYTALNNFKSNRAASIAARSNFTEVKECFFECLGEFYDEGITANLDDYEKGEMLRHLYKNAIKVDESHPLVEQLKKELTDLQE